MKTISVKLTMSESLIEYVREGLEAQYMVKKAVINKLNNYKFEQLFPNGTITPVRIKLTLYESCKDSHLVELGNFIHHYGWTDNDKTTKILWEK
jgi:hypothetical protein